MVAKLQETAADLKFTYQVECSTHQSRMPSLQALAIWAGLGSKGSTCRRAASLRRRWLMQVA